MVDLESKERKLIMDLDKKLGYPYIQRHLWINQMGPKTIPQVFKISIIIPRFGIHILDQRQEGRNLEGV